MQATYLEKKKTMCNMPDWLVAIMFYRSTCFRGKRVPEKLMLTNNCNQCFSPGLTYILFNCNTEKIGVNL